MPRFEYRVVPAPDRGTRAKGAKGTAGRFANAIESLMNEMGAAGWEYQRTDTLPCLERVGLTGKQTTFQHMLVFRREIEAVAETLSDREVTALLAAPIEAPEEAPEEAEIDEEVTAEPAPARDKEAAAKAAVAALSAHSREGKAPRIGPANPERAEVAAE